MRDTTTDDSKSQAELDRVWDLCIPRMQKLVLLAIVFPTTPRNPSVEYLAHKCRLTPRTTRKALKELVAAGLITEANNAK